MHPQDLGGAPDIALIGLQHFTNIGVFQLLSGVLQIDIVVDQSTHQRIQLMMKLFGEAIV